MLDVTDRSPWDDSDEAEIDTGSAGRIQASADITLPDICTPLGRLRRSRNCLKSRKHKWLSSWRPSLQLTRQHKRLWGSVHVPVSRTLVFLQ